MTRHLIRPASLTLALALCSLGFAQAQSAPDPQTREQALDLLDAILQQAEPDGLGGSPPAIAAIAPLQGQTRIVVKIEHQAPLTLSGDAELVAALQGQSPGCAHALGGAELELQIQLAGLPDRTLHVSREHGSCSPSNERLLRAVAHLLHEAEGAAPAPRAQPQGSAQAEQAGQAGQAAQAGQAGLAGQAGQAGLVDVLGNGEGRPIQPKTLWVVAAGLNVRSAPVVAPGNLVGGTSRGSQLTVVAERDGWYRITDAGWTRAKPSPEAWVSGGGGSLLSETKPEPEAPVAQGPGAPSPERAARIQQLLRSSEITDQSAGVSEVWMIYMENPDAIVQFLPTMLGQTEYYVPGQGALLLTEYSLRSRDAAKRVEDLAWRFRNSDDPNVASAAAEAWALAR